MKNLAIALIVVVAFVTGMIVNAGVEQNQQQLMAEYHADQAEWQR